MFSYERVKSLLMRAAGSPRFDASPLPPEGGHVIRSETHFLIWYDEIGSMHGFGNTTVRPTIGWTTDMNLASIMSFDDAEGRLGAFPPGSCRIAKVTRIEVES